MFYLKRSVSAWIILGCVVCYLQAAPSFAAVDYWPTQGWRASTPEEQGMDAAKLADMLESVKEKNYGIDSITIVRNGYAVTDAYFYPFQKGMKHIIHSCTKSITSALVGIALAKGYITDVNQPVLEFFPDQTFTNLDAHKRAMTLRDLLMMASGLECRDSYLYRWEGLYKMKASRDWVQHILDRPMAGSPGKKFDYSNGVSFLISAIIQKTTKMTTLDFATKYLFGPLGISHVKWRKSPLGIWLGWGEMWLRPNDMAKFGWLYLNKGRWEGKQIVLTSWVEASTRGHINATLFPRYGYQWWVEPGKYYMAVGYAGQYIFIVPEKNMVVVFTSHLRPKGFYVPRKLLDHYIIPAASSSGALPANPQETARLDSLLKTFARAPAKGFVWTSEKEGAAKNGVFVRTAPPAFQFEYPLGSRKAKPNAPGQIMAMRTPDNIRFQASVIDIPENMKLSDFGPRFYGAALENVGSHIRVVSNREIRLKDGAEAYRTVIEWLFQDSFPVISLVVSAFKDGKCVFLTAHPWQYPDEVAPIVESLTFKKLSAKRKKQ